MFTLKFTTASGLFQVLYKTKDIYKGVFINDRPSYFANKSRNVH